MRLFALDQRTHIGDEVNDPDQRQPEIDIPFRLGVFLALGDTEDIAKRSQNDEKLVAEEQEPADGPAAEQPRPAGPLPNKKRRTTQGVPPEAENGSPGVDRHSPPERPPPQPTNP